MRIQWIGGPTFLLELGRFRLLADPVFGVGENAFEMLGHPSITDGTRVARLVDRPNIAMDSIDALLISHARIDHFDRVACEELARTLPVIGPTASRANMESAGYASVSTFDWWEEREERKGDETLKIVATPTELPGQDPSKPTATGYVLTHSVADKTQTVYWTGDTLWFNDARKLKQQVGQVDLMMINIGAVGAGSAAGMATLNGKEAMQFVFMFQPKRVVPISYQTFSHYTESIDDFKRRIDLTMYDRRLVLLSEGETFERK